MNSPTLNPYYNHLLVSWEKDTGKPQLPTCEECNCDMTGQQVHESHAGAAGWVCEDCHRKLDLASDDDPELATADRSTHASSLNYVGGGYAIDSSGSYVEAFWAGTP